MIKVQGVGRTYRIAVPSLTSPAPLIILLHGMGSSAADIDQVSDFPRRGTAAGAIVVTPNAIGDPTIWRAGEQSPDFAFVDTLIKSVGARYCVDTSRTGLVGFSVGAVFAAAYACTHDDHIAAIVTIEVDAPGPCTKPMPMPILAYHGTADPIVPYAPPAGTTALGGGSGTEANLTNWAKISRCSATPTTTKVSAALTKLEWPRCSKHSEVILYKIFGGGHVWPTESSSPASTHPTSAATDAVNFVERHPLQS